MNFNLLIIDSYGLFVWPAFIFTFLSLFYLYLKTKSELKKMERVFLLEFNKTEYKEYNKIQFSKREKIKKEILQTN